MTQTLDAYRSQLAGLQKIRSIAGGNELDLPQICVVGDQSSGKSALLGEITSINFPVNSGICTRAPIVVECKCDETLAADVYQIETEGGASKNVHKAEDLASEISALQKKALESEGPETKISKKEIRVCVRGPQQINIIVIDLPGIIHNGPGKEETKELIDTYIQKEQTLILLVSEAKQDDEGCAAIGMAQNWDEDSQRTLRVFTKCDTWDSDASKKRLEDRMRDQDGQGSDKLQPHAVICRMSGKDAYDAEVEMKELKDMNLPTSRFGMSALKKRLPPLFADLICTNLPGLERNIKRKLEDMQNGLGKVGTEPTSGDAMLLECQRALQTSLVSCLQEPLSEHFSAFKEGIHGTKDQVTKEWSDSKLKENVFECPFFQGAPALRDCMKDVTSWWRPIMDKYVAEVEKITRAHIKDLLVEQTRRVPRSLCKVIGQEWEVECNRIFCSLKTTFVNRLEKEIPWGTVNHYLTCKFKGEEALPQELIDDVISLVKPQIGSLYSNSTTFEQTMRSLLGQAKERWSTQFQQKSLHEQQQQRLFHAVEAVFDVEKKTFTDYILKETTEHLVDPRNHWVATALFSNTSIKDAAVEDSATERQRQELKDKLQRMEECMMELRKMQSHDATKPKADTARRHEGATA